MNVAEAYRKLGAQFRAACLATPDLDARVLVGALANIEVSRVFANDAPLSGAQIAQVEEWAQRRLKHESVARIVGHKEFWTLRLALSPATLEPRPDSETLIEAALTLFDQRKNEALGIADPGTGSGALLLALLSVFPNSFGYGTDISLQALITARANAAAHGLAQRAQFICCEWLAALCGPFDLIVSNPPYIASGDIPSLPPEVALYDPRPALDGGADGLDAYRALAPAAAKKLKPGGLLLVEAGAGQAGGVSALLEQAGLNVTGRRKDLAGHERVVMCRKKALESAA